MKNVNCKQRMRTNAIGWQNRAFLYGADGGVNAFVRLPSAQLFGVCQPLVSVRMRKFN